MALAVAGCGAFAALAAAPAQAVITGTDNANTLANALSAVPVSSATLDAGSDPPTYPNGIANENLAGFPTNADTFTIMTTGDATRANAPNDSESESTALGYSNPSRGDAQDTNTLGVGVDAPAGSSCLVFDFKFFSDEFPEFVGSAFNDRFIAELDGSDWTAAGQTSTAPRDFAAPVGTQISINSIGPTAVSPENAAGTTYDAASALIATKTPVTPGAHTLFLSIFDASDQIYDSAAFVDNLHFTDEPPSTCHPPDIFQGQVGVSLGTKTAKVVNGKAIIPITCGLPVNATINCDGNITLLVGSNALKRQAVISRKKKIGKKKFSIPPGATAKVKVKLSKKAKKALAKKGKLKAKAKVKNTRNGATKTFKLKLKRKK
jgi:hypothetical protein